uniref:Uncharacterized protein n=1 Tax=Anguilla anguilla TaxID=7936 RepID=A0A0E9UHA7_ANGAN
MGIGFHPVLRLKVSRLAIRLPLCNDLFGVRIECGPISICSLKQS